MTNNQYKIERMTKDELNIATYWTKLGDMNPGLNDVDCFYQTDPHGFFVGKLNDKPIAFGSAVIYDEHFAFCGYYMVHPEYRGQGYGLALTEKRLAYIGARNAGIDGVLDMVEKYKRLGYRIAHANARYDHPSFSVTVSENDEIIPLDQVHFEQLLDYDARHFPARRSTFLNAWINQKGSKALGCVKNNTLVGYAVLYPCHVGYKIGPLFADDSSIAKRLFLQLAQYALGKPISIFVPEYNEQAIGMMNHYGFEKAFEVKRMYLKGEPAIEKEHIYGITTINLG